MKKIKLGLRIVIVVILCLLVYLETNTKKTNNNITKIDPPSSQEKIIYVPKQITEVTSDSYIFYDYQSERTYYEYNSESKIIPASLVKLFTINEALKYVELTEEVKIGKEVYRIGPNSSSAYLKLGKVYTVHELITLMLIPSANDASYSLANYVGKKLNQDSKLITDNLETFLKHLNNSLQEDGYLNTEIKSVDGYDIESYTTVNDLRKLINDLLKKDFILEITAKDQINIKGINYRNTNLLINDSSLEKKYYTENVTGLKTGSLAGNFNLIFSYKIDDNLYIGMSLANKTKEEPFKNSKIMIDRFRNR